MDYRVGESLVQNYKGPLQMIGASLSLPHFIMS